MIKEHRKSREQDETKIKNKVSVKNGSLIAKGKIFLYVQWTVVSSG